MQRYCKFYQKKIILNNLQEFVTSLGKMYSRIRKWIFINIHVLKYIKFTERLMLTIRWGDSESESIFVSNLNC